VRPEPDQVLHFSEDPTITRFTPHVAATPLGPPEPVGDLLELHEEADIHLRVLTNLWPLWDRITTSTLGFSGIRLHNARPRPERDPDGRTPR